MQKATSQELRGDTMKPPDTSGKAAPPAVHSPKLLDKLRHELRMEHYALSTEEAYVDWVYRYILFHNKRDSSAPLTWRHPGEMGAEEIKQFLIHLAVERHVAASTQKSGTLWPGTLDSNYPSRHHVWNTYPTCRALFLSQGFKTRDRAR
jgi:hypothetical protein